MDYQLKERLKNILKNIGILVVVVLLIQGCAMFYRTWKLKTNCDFNNDGKVTHQIPITTDECDNSIRNIEENTWAISFFWKSDKEIQDLIKNSLNNKEQPSINFKEPL